MILTWAVKSYLTFVMELKAKHAGGRPRGFDRSAALETAMRLFWRHGYEGVSFQQLTTAMNLSAPSLYAAFGNKAALYRECLDRYIAMRGGLDLSFLDDHLTLSAAARALLDGTAEGLLDPAGEIGCMVNTGMMASHPDHAELAGELVERRTAFRRLLAAKLLRWVDANRAESLSRYLSAMMQGMAVQARDGATVTDLKAIAEEACSSLDQVDASGACVQKQILD